uniref:Retrovirus-related Pol polyprotein from transposon 412 family n=1 Tax=Cajanus cajan TaxID=3821 RepID=A0A151RWJ9_CAJCA|nr:Retrovirus-related Pol polyprotein from transposon 412 family [Cajanus cajan]
MDLDPRLGEEERIEPGEDLIHFQLGRAPEQVTSMGSQLSEIDLNQVRRVVKDNRDLFAWTAANMPGIDPKFLSHRLAVCRDARPIAQKKRKMGDEKRKAANAEIQKLLQAKFIKEVTYTTWLANVVLVKKSSGKWRMCTDYTDLNKACPKDAYPLPYIDRLVDDASDHSIFSFLDAYSGYNQIKMHPANEEKTAFITENANFCYKVMPFGLKNAGATYQRLMDKVFQRQIGRNMDIYVDDMVVRSNSVADHLADLSEVFGELRKHNMRLNPEKCTFGVKGGKFLGFMLSARGIEANRDKCRAVLEMRTDKINPMTKLLRKTSAFSWNEACEEAFMGLKINLASLPILTRPDPSCPLEVYLAVSENAISSVLVQEREGSQVPIYFISRLLQDPETRYQLIERVALCLVHTSRRLRHYFLDFVNELHPHGYFEEHLWTLHVDGSSNSQGSGAGVILEGPKGITLEQSLRFRFKASNNQAEYEALLAGLRLAEDMGASRVRCLTDSKVVAEQVSGNFQAKDHNMIRTTVSKLTRAGYYWPTMNTDCAAFVKKCQPCQKHGNLILNQPSREAKGAWAEQLPEVLWAYRCTPQSTTQETPFRLVYGSEAMIPVEIEEPSFRRVHFDEANNEAELRLNLDVVGEIRDRALVVAEATKQRYKRRFDSKVKPREFRERDLVWRTTGEARKDPRQGKLAPNWDGPFESVTT